ncbi:MAG: pseudaminic acid cytidylyltransferase [Pseudomonadota bacterium]
MNIAIIPARGGSKRIPRKNVKTFNGKPMIAFAIEAGLRCEAIGRVLVSTEDDEIAELALELGAEVPFRRPKELADDHTPTVPVIKNALESCHALGIRPENVCCIYPCVPFIRVDDLNDAFELLQAGERHGYTFPVAQYAAPIQRALKRGDDGTISPFDASHTLTRTQDLEPAFFDAGQFYWASAQTWLSGADIHQNGRAIVMPLSHVVDIDTPDDWHRAEILYRAQERTD